MFFRSTNEIKKGQLQILESMYESRLLKELTHPKTRYNVRIRLSRSYKGMRANQLKVVFYLLLKLAQLSAKVVDLLSLCIKESWS